VEDFARARRTLRLAAIPLVSLLLFLAAAPGTFVDASRRILSPGTTFDAPAPFRLVVEPGDVELARGDELHIYVRAEGQQMPRAVVLSFSNLDEEHVEHVRLTPDSTGGFSHRLTGLRKSFRYRAEAMPVTSGWYRAEVTEHPLVRNLQVTLDFPAYSRIPPQRLDANVGDVTGLPGTRVSLALDIGGSDPSRAFLQFDDGSTYDLEVGGENATGSFRLGREGTYQIILENETGIRNRDPITYVMGLVSDAAPAIVFEFPEPDAVLSEELRSGMGARMSDDFGFRDLRLFYRLAESRFGQTSEEFGSMEIPGFDPASLDQEVRYDWRIPSSTGLDLVPGDVVEYYLQVRDNDAVAGFKAAQTAVQRLRLPSLAEQYEKLDEHQDEIETDMEEVLRKAEEIGEQFEEIRDELRREQDADWEDRRQLEQLQKHQEELEQQVDQLSEQVQSMNDNMQENNLLSPETLEMYQEMQKVVEEINSPELMDALRQLQQSIQELNLPQMQQSLENFEFNEQQYKDRLERALELFKNLRAQQSLEEAARRAEELAKQQERLSESTEKLMEEEGEEVDSEKVDSKKEESEKGESEKEEGETPGEEEQRTENGEQRTDPEALARDQELSSEEMKQLEKLLQEAQEQIESMKRGPSDKMKKLNQEVQQQQMPQKMQENAEELRKNELQDAKSGQQQMQQQLQQLQSQLSQMRQSMQGSQMQVNMAGLRRSLSDILTLSQQQEDLRAGLQNNASEAPSMREDARRQVELSEGLSTVVDSLQQLARNIPQMSREVQRQAGEALRAMGQATAAMTERAAGQAAGHQQASMMHLNELALLLSDVMNQMMNSSGSGSGTSMQQMMQQMQQMGQQQSQLNQQIQQFLNDMQGTRLSADMQQRLQQMGAQQQAIKQQLEQLRRNPESRGQLLGDLQKIADQMEETIRDLERRNVDRNMIQRQQQILQRLLDAQRSMQQRGEENRREAREGRDLSRESPDDLPPREAAEKLRRDLIRALESGYSPDYEELIKRYFELLQKQTLDRE
ncbi:MAG: chromosome partitioning protein ParA, partial [Rhodothermales bacterium]